MRTRHQIALDMAVLEAQAGDGQAFERIVSHWQKRLWLSARRMVGRRLRGLRRAAPRSRRDPRRRG